MRLHTLLAACLLAATTSLAVADPTGTYNVTGVNPDSGGQYHGTVTVRRTGDTYKVVWNIAGRRYVGTGIGAYMANNMYLVGPADHQDSSLSVGYVSGRSYGMAFYFEQPDGTWKGVWTYAGSNRVASEEWRPR